MGDNVTVDNGGLSDFVVSSDEATSGQVQRFKLAYSADGADTHVTADSWPPRQPGHQQRRDGDERHRDHRWRHGLRGRHRQRRPRGRHGHVAGPLAAGTAYIGSTLIGNATARADMLSLTSGTALAVGLYDSAGAQVTFAAPIAISATPTNGTAAYSVGDTMGTTITLASASEAPARRATSSVPGATWPRTWRRRTCASGSSTRASRHRPTTRPSSSPPPDIVKSQGVVLSPYWYEGGTVPRQRRPATPIGHPLAYETSGTVNLYGVMESRGTGTYATATVSVELVALRD